MLIDMLHRVYLAESLLGEPLQRVSAYVDSRDISASVEDIALCRYETATKAALVNIGWGLVAGGIEVSGTNGRVSIRYENGGTAPWAPLEHVLVSTPAETRIELAADSRRGNPLGISQSIYDSFEHVVVDFAEAVLTGRAPTASGADGQRILEATAGAYESAATGEVVNVPLEQADPVFQHGVLGVRQLVLSDWSPLRQRSLYTARATG